MINRFGVNRSGFSFKTKTYLFRTFIRTMVGYGLYLTPRTISVGKAVLSLYRHFFRLVAGEFRGPQVDRLLALCNLEPLNHRRRIIPNRLEKRLKTCVGMATLKCDEREISSAIDGRQAFLKHTIAVNREIHTDRTFLHNRRRESEDSRVRAIPCHLETCQLQIYQ